MKVALVYDRVNKWGGAERLLLALHTLFPNAPLYTSVFHAQKASWANIFDVRASFLQSFPYASSLHELYAPVMPFVFESFTFDDYDIVISVTSDAAKGIITKPKTLHICYCLTPTRYLWSGYKDYFRDKIMQFAAKPLLLYLKAWDTIAAQRPDAYIAISKEVQNRIKKYYGREAEMIYPPITLVSRDQLLEPSKDQRATNLQTLASKPYFLVVSRLVPYKRIDIAVEAFNRLGLPLKIVGNGIEEKSLRLSAMPNVQFLGSLTDEELLRYYRGCTALVFPGVEDFGLAMVEAQAMGRPVIAFAGGGALEIVTNEKTGILFAPQTPFSLIEAVKKLQKMHIKEADCMRQSQKFSKKRFEKEFLQILETFLRLKKNSV